MPPKLELFYDVVSPYSYLALEALTRLSAQWKIELVLRPFFLGGVMQASGNKPPATVPAKGSYMMKDLEQLARLYFRVPLTPPAHFPSNTLPAVRLLTAMSLDKSLDKSKLQDASLALSRAYWGQGKEIADPSVIEAALTPGVLDKAQLQTLFKASQTPEVKNALKASTDEAVERGAFGSPTMFLHLPGREPTMYFGADRLHLIALELGVPFPAHL